MSDYNNVFNYRIGSHTSSLGRPPQFYRSDLLHKAGCTFASVYAVRAEDARAIQETAQTAAGFKGIVWSQRLWVDFDNTEGAAAARTLLKERGYDYVEYDTGGRGSHFGILRDADPSHVLPAIDKAWVATALPQADLSLYWHLHLIRLPGTIHERTGFPKRLVSRQSGQSLIIPNVLPDKPEVIPNEDSRAQGQRATSIFRTWSVVSKLTGGVEDGHRHGHIVNLAVALRNDTDIPCGDAVWVCQEVNRGFEEPKPEEEVERIVRWAYEKD